MSDRSCRSTFLFATPGFIEGFSRVADLGNWLSIYNSAPSATAADLRATQEDWLAVGDDLRWALDQSTDDVVV